MEIYEMCEALVEHLGIKDRDWWEVLQAKEISVFPTSRGETCVVHFDSLKCITEDGTIGNACEITDCFDKPEKEIEEMAKFNIEWTIEKYGDEISNVTRDEFLAWAYDFTMNYHHRYLQDMFEAIMEMDKYTGVQYLFFTVSEDEIDCFPCMSEEDYERAEECGDDYIILCISREFGNETLYTVHKANVTKKEEKHFKRVRFTAKLVLTREFDVVVPCDEDGYETDDSAEDIADNYLSDIGDETYDLASWETDDIELDNFYEEEILTLEEAKGLDQYDFINGNAFDEMFEEE